jgi:hypothetical protein
MAIYGYSERGIINSIIFSIGDNVQFMADFISNMNIPALFENKTPTEYDVLLEQSFSRFGSADLVIIIKYDKEPKNNKVLFIEGKVKTSQKTYWNLENQYEEFKKRNKKKSSNLFFQLHLKKLLFTNAEKIDTALKVNEELDITEEWYDTKRKIGKNVIVEKAFDMINCSEAFYIGIIPSSVDDIKDFLKKIKKSKDDPIVEHIHLVSWHTVQDFCKLEKLQNLFSNVKLNFEYNKGRFSMNYN